MVLKGVNWGDNNKIGSNGLERSQIGYTFIHNSGQYGLERSQLGTQYIKSGYMVLKGVKCLYTKVKFRSYALERSQLSAQ